MVSWWGGRGGEGLGLIKAVPPRPRRNRCACNFVAGHCASDRRLEASGACYRGPHHESRRPADSWPVKPVPAEASRTAGSTTKPAPLAPAIALLPAGSAFFSLVFFADAKKSDRQPPQGDVVWLLGARCHCRRNKQRPPPQGDAVRLLGAKAIAAQRNGDQHLMAATQSLSHQLPMQRQILQRQLMPRIQVNHRHRMLMRLPDLHRRRQP